MKNEVEKSVVYNSTNDNSKLEKLISVANPNIDKPVHSYDFKGQYIIITFTRIFNIKQFLYIVNEYKPDVKLMNHTVLLMKEAMKHLSDELKELINYNYENEMDIFSLIENEIDCNIFDTSGIPLAKATHIIALEALKLEYSFQKLNIEYQNSINRKTSRKRNERKGRNLIKKIYENTIISYEKYIQNMDATDEVIDNSIESVFTKKEAREIKFQTFVTKNTISFKNCMERKNNIAANTFRILFHDYASKIELDSSDLAIMAGHISYFRVANIAKILALINLFDIHDDYNGVKIGDILYRRLYMVKDSVPNLFNIEPNKALELLVRDSNLLISNTFKDESEIDFEFLFGFYIDLERTWMMYDKYKMEKFAKSYIDKIKCFRLNSDFYIIDGFFKSYAEAVGFKERINKMNGKVIDFPM